MIYPDAAKAAGYDHALLPTGEVSPNGRLPYYGEWLQDDVLGSGDPHDATEKRWGRFPNPTVHIGLGQLRRVVNALIHDLGHPPAEIAVEMTRAFKLSPLQLMELEREQAANQRKNEERRTKIRELGQPDNARNVLKMRLWEELNLADPLDRRCPFSGELISIARLLSDDVEIEHLIPFSESWDDSAANKVVCLRSANRLKGKQTPYEAFGRSPGMGGHGEASVEIAQEQALAVRAGRATALRCDGRIPSKAIERNRMACACRKTLPRCGDRSVQNQRPAGQAHGDDPCRNGV